MVEYRAKPVTMACIQRWECTLELSTVTLPRFDGILWYGTCQIQQDYEWCRTGWASQPNGWELHCCYRGEVPGHCCEWCSDECTKVYVFTRPGSQYNLKWSPLFFCTWLLIWHNGSNGRIPNSQTPSYPLNKCYREERDILNCFLLLLFFSHNYPVPRAYILNKFGSLWPPRNNNVVTFAPIMIK